MIDLVKTCSACPEQYNAFIDGEQVGYLRLRHGYFRVEVPDVGGNTVYAAYTIGDGMFEDSEREYHLYRAKEAILTHFGHDRPKEEYQYNVSIVAPSSAAADIIMQHMGAAVDSTNRDADPAIWTRI